MIVIVADCPWKFKDNLPGPKRGAASHYKTMSVKEICDYGPNAFGFPELPSNAVLFLWRVASMQVEALTVCRAWGFEPHSELVWLKTTKTGKRHFGMGRIVRGEHETCLIAKRGKVPPVKDRSVRSTFSAPVGRHSAKPDAFYRIVERLYDGPYVELFARTRRENWTQFGDELK